MSYQVGVDLGTTYSAAAVCRPDRDAAETVSLGEHASAVASTVFVGDDGAFLIGEQAERRALAEPVRVVREFKRRIGDETPVLVGREPVPAEALAARFVAQLLQQIARREGGRPSTIALTHPAGWGPHKLDSLRSALDDHGVGPVRLLPEPQAAAVAYAHAERVEPGSVVAVYDLGGGTFDAALVRKTEDGDFELLGHPDGLEHLGGVDFDEAVFDHVRMALGPAWEELDATDPEVLAAVTRLRRECTAAKEGLSGDTEVEVPVMLPGIHTRVRIGRAEFEDMIRPHLLETVEATSRTIDSAGLTHEDVTAVLLVGGSSRIPLVTQLLSAGIGRPVAVDVDAKAVIATGAALVARGTVEQPGVPAPAAPAGEPDPEPAAEAGGDTAAVPPPVTTPAPRGPAPGGPAPGRWAPTGPTRPSPASAGRAGRSTRTRLIWSLVAGVLGIAVLGGAVALDVFRIGAQNEAGATPAAPVGAVSDTPAARTTGERPPGPQQTTAPATTDAPSGGQRDSIPRETTSPPPSVARPTGTATPTSAPPANSPPAEGPAAGSPPAEDPAAGGPAAGSPPAEDAAADPADQGAGASESGQAVDGSNPADGAGSEATAGQQDGTGSGPADQGSGG
ncbi:MAG: Hsp70 family protein [Pseudonocardia sp.]|nr:Hsp70 family protein [Pseudonocardia sp.]